MVKVAVKLCCFKQDTQIVLLLNHATTTSESTVDGCMMILQASDLPFVSVSRPAYADVWRLKELKASLAISTLSFYLISSN